MSQYESQDLYTFTFNTTATGVVSMRELDDGRWESESVRGYTFATEQDAAGQVTAVERSRSSRGVDSLTRYEDQDGDGQFVEVFSAKVATDLARPTSLDRARFTFDDTTGDVLGMQELSKGRWKQERLDRNESLEQITIDGVDYVVKVEVEFDEWSADYYRDDNGDGIWTEVASIEATTEVDLVGVAAILAGTDGLIG